MTTVKVKIRVGSSEIEVEGSKSDVDGFVENWWQRVGGNPVPGQEAEDRTRTRNESKTRPPTKRKKSSASSAPATSNPKRDFDANALANKIKDDPQFHLHEKTILHKADRFNKVAFVCYHAEKPVTSGDIHKTLLSLGVKIGLPGVSTTLGDNRNSFINSKPRKAGVTPEYELTSKALAEFKKVLVATT